MVARMSRCNRSQEVRICGRCFSAMTRPSRSSVMRFAGASATLFQRLQEFGMGGNARAAADELDRRALIDIDLPSDLPQERRAEEARQRATDDDPARGWVFAWHARVSVPHFLSRTRRSKTLLISVRLSRAGAEGA